jgi:hypothetical protein
VRVSLTQESLDEQAYMTPSRSAEHIGFDYSALPADIAETMRQRAARIRSQQQGIARNIIETGRELIRAKAALPHGAFGPWLQAEFGWNERTAQRYMRAAEMLGEKSGTVSVLGATAIHALAARSTPQRVRDDVVTRLETGERVTAQTVLEQVRVARREAAVVPASRVSEPQVLEQEPDAALVGTHCQPALKGEDRQADASIAARRAAEMIFEQFEHGREELACLLEEADADELLKQLLQGCAVVARTGPDRERSSREIL